MPALPDFGTLKARFARELTSNVSLEWYNTNVGAAFAQAIPAIQLIAAQRFAYNRSYPQQVDSALRVYLLERYGYVTIPHINGNLTIGEVEAFYPTIGDWEAGT